MPYPQRSNTQTYGPGGTRFLLTETIGFSNVLQYKFLSTMLTQSEFVLNASLYKYYRIEKIYVSIYPSTTSASNYVMLDWEGSSEFSSAQELIDSDSVKLRFTPSYRVQNITFKPPNTTFISTSKAYNFKEWVSTKNSEPPSQLIWTGASTISGKLNILLHFRGAQDLNVATLITKMSRLNYEVNKKINLKKVIKDSKQVEDEMWHDDVSDEEEEEKEIKEDVKVSKSKSKSRRKVVVEKDDVRPNVNVKA